jgi:hypothetical protein
LQEAFVDANRDESFIIELLELKENVADAGSARWFLQDLATEQGSEKSLVCLLSFPQQRNEVDNKVIFFLRECLWIAVLGRGTAVAT